MSPANGIVTISGNSPGDKATHSCDTGFELVGDDTLTCGLDGMWSPDPPVCRRELTSDLCFLSTERPNITGYGSTLYIGIAMVFVFSPYIRKLTTCFQFQVNFTFN